MRPLLTATPPIPSPMPVNFQASGGPSLGHSLRRPVSFETAVRSGPCHCGQSSAKTGAPETTSTKSDTDLFIDGTSLPGSVKEQFPGTCPPRAKGNGKQRPREGGSQIV